MENNGKKEFLKDLNGAVLNENDLEAVAGGGYYSGDYVWEGRTLACEACPYETSEIGPEIEDDVYYECPKCHNMRLIVHGTRYPV